MRVALPRLQKRGPDSGGGRAGGGGKEFEKIDGGSTPSLPAARIDDADGVSPGNLDHPGQSMFHGASAVSLL